MFIFFKKNTEIAVLETKSELKSERKYTSLTDYMRADLEQEAYNIKWEIYALTKNLDVMSMSLDDALKYKMLEDLRYKNYKQSKYDASTGFPRNSAELNVINLFFQFECLSKENKLDEVLNCIENMTAFYNMRTFPIYLSYCYFLQGLNRKPCNQNLTAFMTSIGAWPKRLGD